jgi:predicted metal-dependent HD superfamily phosphohydrolase
MELLGIPEDEETFDALVAAYAEKHRHYHTGKHIEHCLQELDSVAGLATEQAEVELALWFHDAVYNPYSSGNEERSADWACSFLGRHAVNGDCIGRIRELILATRHAVPATTAPSPNQLRKVPGGELR